MPDVLHLIDGPPSPLILRLIADAHTSPTHARTWLLGGTPMRSAADAVRLAYDLHLPLPYANALLGLPALRYALKRCPKPEVLHCWTPTTLTAARWLMPSVPRVFTPKGRSLTLGFSAELIDRSGRQAIRQAWGVGPSHDVVALLGDQSADAYHTTLATAIAGESINHGQDRCVDLRLLVLPRQRHRPHAQQMLDDVGQSHLLMQDSRLALPWAVLPACDVALIVEEEPAQLATRWAMLAGTPIVAQATAGAQTLLEHDQTALLSSAHDLRTLAHHLTQTLEDRASAGVRACHAQQKIADKNSLPRFHASLNEAYDQAMQADHAM